MTLHSKRPTAKIYPASLRTVGDHIRSRRLDLGLFQKDVAARIGVTTSTVWNWERGRSEPGIKEWAGVIRFLGYIPFDVGDSCTALIKAYRFVHGLSQREMAMRFGVDESTVWRWETGRSKVPQAVAVAAREIIDGLGLPIVSGPEES